MKTLEGLRKFASNIAELDRGVKLIVASYLVFYTGDGLFIFTLPVYIRQLNATPSQVGLLFALNYISAGMSILLGGYLADRFDLKTIIIISSLVWLPMPLTLAFATNWTQIILPMMFYGTNLGFAAVCSYLIKATEKKNRMFAFGLWSSSQSLSYVFSPIIGGFISSTIGKQPLFLTAFVFYSFSIIPLLAIKRRPRERVQYVNTAPVNENSKNKRKVIQLSIVFCVAMFLLFLIYPLITLFENEVYHQSIFSLGIFGTMTFAGWAFFSFLLGKIGDVLSQLKAFTIALGITSFSLVLLLAFNNLILLCLASFLSGASFTILYLAPGIIGSSAPEQSIAKWVSISEASVFFVGSVGSFLGGSVYEIWAYLPFLIAIVALTILTVTTTKINL